VTTLGRAGGDTTAVRLAAALGAEVCEIYTGLPGIWTADPHVVPEAAVLDHISYEEALELAAMGLPVSQPRAVEIAEQFGVPIHFRPLNGRGRGTMIVSRVPAEHRKDVCAVAHQGGVAKVRLSGVPDRPGGGADVFEPLLVHGISVDVIAHVAAADLTFMVRESDLDRTIEVLRPAADAVGAVVSHDHDLAKISVVGIAMPERTGVAATMFRTLANEGVNIDMIATSEIRITCIVRRVGHERAVRALHSAFGLGRD
jgi:aspartate kinase